MKNIIAAAAIVLASAANALAASRSELVPLNVVHVAPLGEHQLIVYSVCSPEHCWHTFYIRKVAGSDPAKVVCRRAVSQLNEASDFIAESVVPAPGAPGQVNLHMVSSHGAFEPAVVTVKAAGACRYQIGQLPAAAANNSSKPTPLRGAA